MNEQTHRWHTNIPGLVEGNTRPVLELLSGYETQVGANRPLFWFCPSCRKTSRTNWSKVYFLFLKTMFFSPRLLVWTGLLKPTRNLVLQTYFADVFLLKHLAVRPTAPFLCQYYSRNTDCLQPMAPHSQTTILDERWSIHCNSSCLYNRCGSTDVYVLYSRVHFYYLQIKDCVEEERGLFEPSAPRLLCTWWLKAHVICWMWLFFFYIGFFTISEAQTWWMVVMSNMMVHLCLNCLTFRSSPKWL